MTINTSRAKHYDSTNPEFRFLDGVRPLRPDRRKPGLNELRLAWREGKPSMVDGFIVKISVSDSRLADSVLSESAYDELNLKFLNYVSRAVLLARTAETAEK